MFILVKHSMLSVCEEVKGQGIRAIITGYNNREY